MGVRDVTCFFSALRPVGPRGLASGLKCAETQNPHPNTKQGNGALILLGGLEFESKSNKRKDPPHYLQSLSADFTLKEP